MTYLCPEITRWHIQQPTPATKALENESLGIILYASWCKAFRHVKTRRATFTDRPPSPVLQSRHNYPLLETRFNAEEQNSHLDSNSLYTPPEGIDRSSSVARSPALWHNAWWHLISGRGGFVRHLWDHAPFVTSTSPHNNCCQQRPAVNS